MELNLRKVAEFIRQAETEELLDRVTVYRAEMEPAAVDLMEGELSRRGFDREAITAHLVERSGSLVLDRRGLAVRCHFCPRPAVVKAWGWQKLWGRIPVFPRFYSYCEVHRE